MIEQVEPVFLDLHAAQWVERDRYTIRSDARRFETRACNYANKVGLAEAINYALSWRLENIMNRVSALAANLRTRLGEVPGIEVHDMGAIKCGIVTFSHENVSAIT